MDNTDEKKIVKKAASYIIRRVIISVFILLVVLFGIWYCMEQLGLTKKKIISDFFTGKGGQVTTISEVYIKKVFEISELSTADYMYNAIAKAYEEDGTTIKYYVAYEGKVKVGIDFDEIEIDIKEEEKCIVITVPKIEFQQTTVNPGTLDYIFKNKKSETENVHQEAYELCQKDLEEKVKQEEGLLLSAEKNTEMVVKALVEPTSAFVNKSLKKLSDEIQTWATEETICKEFLVAFDENKERMIIGE